MGNNTALKKMIGKLPKNWESMSPEDKIRTVLKKWYLIFCDDSFSVDPDYFDIRIVGYGWEVYEPILAFKSLLSNESPYFVFKNPVPGKKFDMTRFPDYLRKIIKKKACKNWDTDERDYNILRAETDSAKTFGEAAESMYFMLDLFEYGYTIDTEENYKSEHPEIYAPAGEITREPDLSDLLYLFRKAKKNDAILMDGVKFSTDKKTLVRFPENSELTEYVIPEGVTEIAPMAFDHCSNLTSIVIPEGVTKIDELTFWNCCNLETVKISSSVTEIENDAFENCPCEEQVKKDYPHLFKRGE